MKATDTALDLLSGLVLDSGRAWGEMATSFQWEDARLVLDQGSPPYSFLTRPRGSSKTSDLAGILIAAMVDQLPPHGRVYAVASDRDQARLLLDAFEGFVRRTPSLRGAFDIGAWRATCRETGVVLEVLAADASGAFGLLPDMIVLDELAQWQEHSSARRLFEAISTAAAKREGCRMIILSTSGDPAHWAHKVFVHAKADPLWTVRATPGPTPWMDPARVEEQRRRLLPSSFARLFMNEWTAAEDRLALPKDVAACVTLDGPQDPKSGRRYVIGVDLGLKHDRSVAAVCHLDGRTIVLDRMQVWSGSRSNPVRLEDVEAWLIEARRIYVGARVVLDPWQGVGMAQRLAERGIRVTEFSFTAQSVGRLAVVVYNAIRDRELAIPDDADLVDELSSVRLRETSPGVYRIDHDPDRHDDRAIALALAGQQLLERGSNKARPVMPLSNWAPSTWSGGGESSLSEGWRS